MRIWVLCSLLALVLPATGAQVDLTQSKVTWMGAKVIGSTHTGEIKIKTADIKYKGSEPVSGQVVIDMTSITNTDLKDKKYNKKLVGHLKSNDFFSVSKFKTAVLDIKKIQKASDEHYLLHGKLKIKGISQDVKLKAQLSKGPKGMQIVTTKFDFDRTKFGIKYGSGSFFEDLGDKMIADEVNVAVKLYLKKGNKLASH